jgi:hypothetical protein
VENTKEPVQVSTGDRNNIASSDEIRWQQLLKIPKIGAIWRISERSGESTSDPGIRTPSQTSKPATMARTRKGI